MSTMDEEAEFEYDYEYDSAPDEGAEGYGSPSPSLKAKKVSESSVSSAAARLSLGSAARPGRKSVGNPNFLVLDAEAVLCELDGDILDVAELWGVDADEALQLLVHYRWSKSKVEDAWLDSEDAARKAAGVPRAASTKPPPGTMIEDEVQLGDSFPIEDCDACACGHYFSTLSWRGHLTAALDTPLTALATGCMSQGCTAAVPRSLWQRVCTPEQYAQYLRQIARTYVEAKPTVGYCPGADCVDILRCTAPSVAELDLKEVTCTNGHVFCFACGALGGHRPASCDEHRKWTKRADTEGGNAQWLLENTKPCPKCNRSIEKANGCNWIRCQGCAYEFCWMCMQKENHNAFADGSHKCNSRPLALKPAGGMRDSALELQLFGFYYKQTQEQDRSIKLLTSNTQPKLHKSLQDVVLAGVGWQQTQCDFLDAAIAALLRGRTVARSSFVHGFHIGSNSSSAAAKAAAIAATGAKSCDQSWYAGAGEKYASGAPKAAIISLSSLQAAMGGAGTGASGSSSSSGEPVDDSPEATHLRLFEHQQAMLLGACEGLEQLLSTALVHDLAVAAIEKSKKKGSGGSKAAAGSSRASVSASASASSNGSANGSSTSSSSSSSSAASPSDPATLDEWRQRVMSHSDSLSRFVRQFVGYVENEEWRAEVGDLALDGTATASSSSSAYSSSVASSNTDSNSSRSSGAADGSGGSNDSRKRQRRGSSSTGAEDD